MASTALRTRFGVVLLSVTAWACRSSPPPPTAPLAGEQPIVAGTLLPLESSVLGEQRNLSLWLPPNYEQRNERFDVLYLVDGGPQQDFLPVAGLAALASLSGQYREFIVVGIETRERRFELTTPSTAAYDRKHVPHNGGADAFRRFVATEVKPLIEGRYRTSGQDAIMGESLAGLFIVDTMLQSPDLFDHYIAVSPSLWWRDGEIAKRAATRLQDEAFEAPTSVYLSVADETDVLPLMHELVGALKAHAPPAMAWWFRPMPTEHHNTIYHPASLEALRLIFGGPRARRSHGT